MRTAAGNVRARLGLSASSASWSYAQRVAYLRALAAEVLKFPASFTAGQIATAQQIAAGRYEDLADPSFDLGALGAEVSARAVPVLAETKWILWGVVGLVVALVVFRVTPSRR